MIFYVTLVVKRCKISIKLFLFWFNSFLLKVSVLRYGLFFAIFWVESEELLWTKNV